MKWIRTLLIISSIGILCASSISDDGALGHKRGGGSDDKGKQSGGDDKKSGGDSGRSNGGGNDNRSRDDNRNKDDNNRNNNNNNRNNNDGGGRSRDRDRDKVNDSGGSSGGSSGGQRDTNDRNRDDNRNNGGVSSGGSSGGQRDDNRNNNDRNNDRLGHGREDRNRDNNSGGSGNSTGGTRDNGDRNRDRDRIGGGNSGGGNSGGGDINRRDRDNRNDDRIIGGGGSSSGGSSSGRTNGGRMDDNFGRQGGGRSDDNLNRGNGTITSGGSRTSSIDPFSKRKPGSSGSTVYGTTNNHRSDSSWSKPPERSRPPMDIFNPSLKGMVRREDNVTKHSRYRSGYYHYNNYWRDDDFFFGFYYFNPVYDRCVVSPFYWYPYVPGYINRSRVLVLRVGTVSIYWNDQPAFFWDSCPAYTYKRTYWYESAARRSELDYALDDLVNAWEDSNRRSLNRLIPSRGNIGIYIDERYDYSMNADDFYDMMMDNIQSARTKRYDILSIKTYRNEARVVAVHEYVDPWDRQDRVYHVYRLVNDGYGYTIADFGTSDRRPSR